MEDNRIDQLFTSFSVLTAMVSGLMEKVDKVMTQGSDGGSDQARGVPEDAVNTGEQLDRESQWPKLGHGAQDSRFLGQRYGKTTVFTNRRPLIADNNRGTGGYQRPRYTNFRQNTHQSKKSYMGNKNVNRESVDSLDPETRGLCRDIFQSCQLKHHERNWQILPVGIEKRLDDVFDNIVPPQPTEDIKQKLKDIARECKEKLTGAVMDHIERRKREVRDKLASYPPMSRDRVDKAGETARQDLRRHFGRKISYGQINWWIGEDTRLVEERSTVPRTPLRRTQTEGGMGSEGFTEGVQSTRKNKRDRDQVSPISTSNRFTVLEELEENIIDDAGGQNIEEARNPSKTPKKMRVESPRTGLDGADNGRSRDVQEANNLQEIHPPIVMQTAIEQQAAVLNKDLTEEGGVSQNEEVEGEAESSTTGEGTQGEVATQDQNESIQELVVSTEEGGTEEEEATESGEARDDRHQADEIIIRDDATVDELDHELEVPQNSSQPVRPQNSRITRHGSVAKGRWEAQVKPSTRVMIISDEGLQAARQLPEDWELHIFPTGNLKHAGDILGKVKKTGNLERVVIAMGSISRTNEVDTVKKHINAIHHAGKTGGIQVHFLGGATAPGWSRMDEDQMRKLNEVARTKFGLHYIPPLPSNEVSGRILGTKEYRFDLPSVEKILNSFSLHFLNREVTKNNPPAIF